MIIVTDKIDRRANNACYLAIRYILLSYILYCDFHNIFNTNVYSSCGTDF